MKKVTIIMLMFISLSAFSQQRDMSKNDRAQKVQMSPEERAEIKSKKMALDLNLTEAQRTEIEKLHLAQATERKAMMEARKKNTQEKATKRQAGMNKSQEKRLALQEKMKEILTDEQYAKWKESAHKPERKNKTMKKKTI